MGDAAVVVVVVVVADVVDDAVVRGDRSYCSNRSTR